jgi:PhnB protein
MIQINPYLNFPGNTEEAFNFYKSVFGGEFTNIVRFSDMPEMPGMPPMDDASKNMIMHIGLQIGQNHLMATDAPASMGFNLVQGNSSYICIGPDNEDQAKKIFNALAEGGKIGQPLQMQVWGDLYGDLTDKFGIKWMVNYNPKQSQS